MLVTTADLWEPRPGTLLCWDLSAPAHGAPAELSLNQRNHLAGAMAGAPTVWLAAAFDVDAVPPSARDEASGERIERLARTARELLAELETLR